MMEFLATFILFTLVEFFGVWWAKSIETAKAAQTGLSAACTELLIIGSMWIALVGESIPGAAGCVAGAGFGAYVGCKFFTRKASLGWSDDLCKSEPLERACKNCEYYKAYYGHHCFNGWSKDGRDGHCHADPEPRFKTEDCIACGLFMPKG